MKGGKFSKLKWVTPKGKPKPLTMGMSILAASPAGKAIRTLFADVGIPTPKDKKQAKTARDEAIFLLQAAAEVEHALLVQYLYAAYSLNFLSPPARILLGTIVEIAKEEMGHLISVQNLLCALGEDPYFDRESVPYSGKPAGDFSFPIKFAPISSDSLAKYVTTECMSIDEVSDPALKKRLVKIFDQAKQANDGIEINHVGALYAKLFWLFQKDDTPNPLWNTIPPDLMKPADWHVKDTDFTGFNDTRQATADEFRAAPFDPHNPGAEDIYVFPVNSRDDALRALTAIAHQGEGPVNTDDSHFVRFLNGYDNFAAIPAAGIRNVPTDPNTSPKKLPADVAEDGRITHPRSVLWARLFDVRYQLLIMDLWLGTMTARTVTGAFSRDDMINAALSEMTDRIGPLAGRMLPTMDLKDVANGDRKAGAPFGLPQKALPSTAKAIKKRMIELFGQSSDLTDQIKGLAEPNAPSSDEKDFLDAMLLADKPFSS